MTRIVVGVVAALALGGAGALWWMAAEAQPVTVDSIGDHVQTQPRGTLPVFANEGDLPPLYAFAVQNPDTLGWMPCTCGCANLGHTSNRSCYVKAESPSHVTFTSHAAT